LEENYNLPKSEQKTREQILKDLNIKEHKYREWRRLDDEFKISTEKFREDIIDLKEVTTIQKLLIQKLEDNSLLPIQQQKSREQVMAELDIKEYLFKSWRRKYPEFIKATNKFCIIRTKEDIIEMKSQIVKALKENSLLPIQDQKSRIQVLEEIGYTNDQFRMLRRIHNDFQKATDEFMICRNEEEILKVQKLLIEKFKENLLLSEAQQKSRDQIFESLDITIYMFSNRRNNYPEFRKSTDKFKLKERRTQEEILRIQNLLISRFETNSSLVEDEKISRNEILREFDIPIFVFNQWRRSYPHFKIVVDLYE